LSSFFRFLGLAWAPYRHKPWTWVIAYSCWWAALLLGYFLRLGNPSVWVYVIAHALRTPHWLLPPLLSILVPNTILLTVYTGGLWLLMSSRVSESFPPFLRFLHIGYRLVFLIVVAGNVLLQFALLFGAGVVIADAWGWRGLLAMPHGFLEFAGYASPWVCFSLARNRRIAHFGRRCG